MPNPPAPNEVKRRRGTYRKDRHAPPTVSKVVSLPMAAGVPEPPEDLGLEGLRLWARTWQEGVVWISPHSDMESVEQACRLVDDLAVARELWRTTRDPVHGRMVVNFSKELTSCLSNLGFTPVSRTRLGVAEVKAASTLDELRNRQRERDARQRSNRDSTGS